MVNNKRDVHFYGGGDFFAVREEILLLFLLTSSLNTCHSERSSDIHGNGREKEHR
jgi:hypothetical protein